MKQSPDIFGAGEAFLAHLMGSDNWTSWRELMSSTKHDNYSQFIGWMLQIATESAAAAMFPDEGEQVVEPENDDGHESGTADKLYSGNAIDFGSSEAHIHEGPPEEKYSEMGLAPQQQYYTGEIQQPARKKRKRKTASAKPAFTPVAPAVDNTLPGFPGMQNIPPSGHTEPSEMNDMAIQYQPNRTSDDPSNRPNNASVGADFSEHRTKGSPRDTNKRRNTAQFERTNWCEDSNVVASPIEDIKKEFQSASHNAQLNISACLTNEVVTDDSFVYKPNKNVNRKFQTCDMCGKTFAHGNLHRHVRSVHSKSRVLACSKCDYKTSRRDHLRCHQASCTKTSPQKVLNENIATINENTSTVNENTPIVPNVCLY